MAVVALASCSSELGRRVPWCDDLNGTMMLSAQAVPGSAYIPCLNDLKPGWSYEHLEAEDGRSRFWLTSDRLGTRFLEVSLERSCSLGNTRQIPSDEPAAALFTEVERAEFYLPITIVPEGEAVANRTYALDLADILGETIVEGRQVRVRLDAGADPTQERIDRALAEERPVFVVGTREVEERTVELHYPRPGSSAGPRVERGITLDDALHEIDEQLATPRYRATWLYLFDGGCVRYEFDAKGDGVAAIPGDAQEALGLLDLAVARRILADHGWDLP
jgi:hypothetical protein